MFGDLPEKYEVTINSNHPLATTILNEKDEEKRNALTKDVCTDLARFIAEHTRRRTYFYLGIGTCSRK